MNLKRFKILDGANNSKSRGATVKEAVALVDGSELLRNFMIGGE
jgi:hypothetical protein